MTGRSCSRSTFLPFALPDTDETEIDEIAEAVRSGWVTTGPKTRQFEQEFAANVGAKHAVAVNSCTAAMHLARSRWYNRPQNPDYLMEAQTMIWHSEKQARLDWLRKSELAGTLTAGEQTELNELVAALEADEADRLAPAVARMREEQEALRGRLRALQAENEELARLLNQLELLAADARGWLAQFEQRHTLIRETYTRLTGEVLVPSVSS